MTTEDLFKDEFKRYKQRSQAVNLSDVIDTTQSDKKVTILDIENLDHPALKGLKPIQEWKAYSIDACPGFSIIRNPFEKGGQRYWVDQCIKKYPLSPNVTNIDSLLSSVENHDVWNYSKTNYSDCITKKQSLLMKLRWVTLGYHYDWDNKKYYPERCNEFPEDLSKLCKYIATVLGFKSFSPEAAIVNYYHMDSTLAGHTDHSELDHDAPLISVSFGQDAIFLLGGLTKETRPLALMLHSGDICIMSGQSRLVYHAVPKILESKTLEDCLLTEKLCESNACVGNSDLTLCNKTEDSKSCKTCEENSEVTDNEKTEDEELFREYMNCTRININVRQVLKPNMTFQDSDSINSASDVKKLKLDIS